MLCWNQIRGSVQFFPYFEPGFCVRCKSAKLFVLDIFVEEFLNNVHYVVQSLRLRTMQLPGERGVRLRSRQVVSNKVSEKWKSAQDALGLSGASLTTELHERTNGVLTNPAARARHGQPATRQGERSASHLFPWRAPGSSPKSH